MKVIETHDYYNSDHDDASNVLVEVIRDNGEKDSVAIGEGQKEDMYLFRDLSDAYYISNLVKLAYEAGKAGEEFNYELIENKDE